MMRMMRMTRRSKSRVKERMPLIISNLSFLIHVYSHTHRELLSPILHFVHVPSPSPSEEQVVTTHHNLHRRHHRTPPVLRHRSRPMQSPARRHLDQAVPRDPIQETICDNILKLCVMSIATL